MPFQLEPNDVLLVIDLQNDFTPGGALAVAEGDTIIPLINSLAQKFPHTILTQDWHPPKHISFATTHNKQPYETIEVHAGPEKITQTLWPDHCLQHTPKAQPSTPPSKSPRPSSSSAKASAPTSTPTPPSSKTTTSRPPASPVTYANASSIASSSAASPTTSASATPPSTASTWASKPSSSKTPPAPSTSPAASPTPTPTPTPTSPPSKSPASSQAKSNHPRLEFCSCLLIPNP